MTLAVAAAEHLQGFSKECPLRRVCPSLHTTPRWLPPTRDVVGHGCKLDNVCARAVAALQQAGVGAVHHRVSASGLGRGAQQWALQPAATASSWPVPTRPGSALCFQLEAAARQFTEGCE